MTAVDQPTTQVAPVRPFPERYQPKGSFIYKLLTTTDHKLIGMMYITACFAFFLIGGLMALLMRGELAMPGMQFLSTEQFNQLFTMHGTVMLLMYATPIVIGFANFVLPLQIGSPDVAFPRLNALGFWLFVFGSTIAVAGFITPGGAADFGWTAYTPLTDAVHSPGIGADLWIMGLAVSGLGTILGGVNMVTTVICLRAPGMTMFRMPIFTWNILVTSVLILLIFPLLTAALMGLEVDRQFGAHIYDPANGGVILANNTEPQNSLLPTNTNEVGGGRVLDLIYAGLIRYDKDGNVINEVASSIETTDNQHFTITLKPGWTFSDGSPVTADSFIKAWKFGALLSNAQLGSSFFERIKGFGHYGFPESHSQSFAGLVYFSAWFKYYYPAEFTVGLLRAQPMGFYSPQSLIADARRHGVPILPVDIARSNAGVSLKRLNDASASIAPKSASLAISN